MATVPAPRTWTVGELLTAAKLNTDLRDGLNFLLSGKPLALLTKTVGQSIPTGGGTNLVTWDAETIDRDGGHSNSVNNTRYTVQTAGWYNVFIYLQWGGAFTAGRRTAYLSLNSNLDNRDFIGSDASGNFETNHITALKFFSVSNIVEVYAQHNLGSALSVEGGSPDESSFSLEWVSS